jgi:hypothetical protein
MTLPLQLRRYDVAGASTLSVVILWVFAITLTGCNKEGLHLELGFSLLCFQLNLGISKWKEILP